MRATLAGVAVVGSINLDLTANVKVPPHPGETVLGTGYSEMPGGKGLNQAVGAARRAPTALLAAVGDDTAGRQVRNYAAERHIDLTATEEVRGATGRALITVTPDGENSIIVAALANRELSGEHVTSALERLRPAVVLAQFEVPYECIDAAARWAERAGARFVFNLSPVGEGGSDLLPICDPLIVNTTEASVLLEQIDGRAIVDESQLALELTGHCRSVIVTAGSAGAYIADRSGITSVPGRPGITPVDTTGAGDEYAGALAAGLALGESLLSAAQTANHAASDLVQTTRDQR